MSQEIKNHVNNNNVQGRGNVLSNEKLSKVDVHTAKAKLILEKLKENTQKLQNSNGFSRYRNFNIYFGKKFTEEIFVEGLINETFDNIQFFKPYEKANGEVTFKVHPKSDLSVLSEEVSQKDLYYIQNLSLGRVSLSKNGQVLSTGELSLSIEIDNDIDENTKIIDVGTMLRRKEILTIDMGALPKEITEDEMKSFFEQYIKELVLKNEVSKVLNTREIFVKYNRDMDNETTQDNTQKQIKILSLSRQEFSMGYERKKLINDVLENMKKPESNYTRIYPHEFIRLNPESVNFFRRYVNMNFGHALNYFKSVNVHTTQTLYEVYNIYKGEKRDLPSIGFMELGDDESSLACVKTSIIKWIENVEYMTIFSFKRQPDNTCVSIESDGTIYKDFRIDDEKASTSVFKAKSFEGVIGDRLLEQQIQRIKIATSEEKANALEELKEYIEMGGRIIYVDHVTSLDNKFKIIKNNLPLFLKMRAKLIEDFEREFKNIKNTKYPKEAIYMYSRYKHNTSYPFFERLDFSLGREGYAFKNIVLGVEYGGNSCFHNILTIITRKPVEKN